MTRPEFGLGEGLRTCKRITRRHAKTFYFASHCLPREVRAHAYAVYGFCRWADDGVDHAASAAEARSRLDHARRVLDLAYGEAPVPPALAAFRKTVRDRAIPRNLFEDLLAGMEMDLTVAHYPDFAALDLYCYRVAGVVGLMMTHVFGYGYDRCLPRAKALGTAMQLTNILRDIAPDFALGRVYLPRDEMERFGVSDRHLVERNVDASFREFMKFQIDRARSFYDEAEAGIPDLIGSSSRLTVRVMGRLYGGILGAIERQDYDVFRDRAHVPLSRKLRTLAACQGTTWRDDLRRWWNSNPEGLAT